MDNSKMLEEAKYALETKVKPGQIFESKELFDGIKWNSLERGKRISFGQYFSEAVSDGRIKGVQKLERGKDNHSNTKKYNQKPLFTERVQLVENTYLRRREDMGQPPREDKTSRGGCPVLSNRCDRYSIV